jgi:hypothetical protein
MSGGVRLLACLRDLDNMYLIDFDPATTQRNRTQTDGTWPCVRALRPLLVGFCTRFDDGSMVAERCDVGEKKKEVGRILL